MKRTLLAVGAMSLGLLTAACDFDAELLDFVAVEDLSSSDDPAEQAAADAAEAVDAIERADALVEQSLADGDLERLADARDLRPDDPYFTQVHALTNYVRTGDPEPRRDANELYLAQERTLRPDADREEISVAAARRRARVEYEFLTNYAGPVDADGAIEGIRYSYCYTLSWLSDNGHRIGDLPADVC